ncbi:MAG: hypothetical protein IJW64_04925, partial [Clostridia bacterium]|nr:hypothetical protein [Clostridia bacterium]
ELLSKNKSLLDVMARVLIERETIYQEEVDLIMAGKTAKEVMEFMDNKEVVTNPFAKAEAKQQPKTESAPEVKAEETPSSEVETKETVETETTADSTHKNEENQEDNNL